MNGFRHRFGKPRRWGRLVVAVAVVAALAACTPLTVDPEKALHVNATIAPDAPFERLFIDLEASPLHDLVLAKDGKVALPDAPGLGGDPDMDVLRRYLIAGPTLHST